MVGPPEASRILNMPRPTIYHLIRTGAIPATRVSGRWFITMEEVERIKANKPGSISVATRMQELEDRLAALEAYIAA